MIYDSRTEYCAAGVGRGFSRITRRASRLVLGFASLLLVVSSVWAFPPAPHHVIHGLVRDEYGEPLSLASAQVFLETTNGVVVTCQVSPDILPGENYRLIVPMDSTSVPGAYKPTALQPSVPFRLKVVIGGVVYLPLEMVGNLVNLGQPAGETVINLTLGVDTDGDGLPDGWEQIIIQMLGGGLTLADINPNGLAPNGMTYLANYIAGTYAWDTNDNFKVAITRGPGNTPVIQFFGVANRTYTIEGTTNLVNWTPMSVRVPPGSSAPVTQSYYNPLSQIVETEVVLPPSPPRSMLFRVRVN